MADVRVEENRLDVIDRLYRCLYDFFVYEQFDVCKRLSQYNDDDN